MNKTFDKGELIRFLICGVICALTDFLVSELFKLICANLASWLIIAISSTAGFLVGVIANYLLSTFWVFKGAGDEKKVKTPLFILSFILLSAVAWIISWGTMQLCTSLFLKLDIDITKCDLKIIFTFTFWKDIPFWCYASSFIVKTILGLIWNYFTRKYILYKKAN